MSVNWGILVPAIGTAAGVATLGWGIYSKKSDKLDTSKNREVAILDRIKGRGWQAGPYKMNVDELHIEERSSLGYRLRRIALRPLEGKTIVSLNSNIEISDNDWTNRVMDPLYDELDIDFEYLNSCGVNKQKEQIIIRVESVESEDIMKVVKGIVEYIKILEENGLAEITYGHSPPSDFFSSKE